MGMASYQGYKYPNSTQKFKPSKLNINLTIQEEMKSMAEVMEERSGKTVDVDELIKMLDKNDNGVVDLEEVVRIVSHVPGQMQQ